MMLKRILAVIMAFLVLTFGSGPVLNALDLDTGKAVAGWQKGQAKDHNGNQSGDSNGDNRGDGGGKGHGDNGNHNGQVKRA